MRMLTRERDATSIPTGEIVSVDGTPMDFRVPKTIGRDIEEDYEALNFGNGYDHNWVLKPRDGVGKVATLYSDKTGIEMEVYTDLPGVQMYTANFVEDECGKEAQSIKNTTQSVLRHSISRMQ